MTNSLSLVIIISLTSVIGADWIKADRKLQSSHIFSGGTVDKQGRKLYVCRALIKGEWASGEVSISNDRLGKCNLPYHGKEISRSNYDVLSSPPWNSYVMQWSDTMGIFSKIPKQSVRVGPGIYVGRYKENKHFYLGKVIDKLINSFYHIVGSRECLRIRGYQILVKTPRPIKRYEILNIEYDFSQASQIVSPEYVTLAQKTVTNDSPFDTTSTLSVDVTDSTTREWSITVGVELSTGISTSVTAGIPSLGDATVGWEIGLTAQFSYTQGKSFTSSVSKTHEVSVELTPNSTARVAVVAKKATVQIPYSATVNVVFENGHPFINKDVSGVYIAVHQTSFETFVETLSIENMSNSGTPSHLLLHSIMTFKLFVLCTGIYTLF